MTVDKRSPRAAWFAIAPLGLLIICLLVQPVITLTARVPKNYNEGWNAFHSLHAMGIEALYPAADQLFTNNYPPLSFYVVGSLAQLVGDSIIAGRLIALVSLIGVTVNIFLILRFPLHCSRAASLFAALLFLGYMGTHYRNYVAMNDPQLLGHAMQTSAVLLSWWAWSQRVKIAGALALWRRSLPWLALGLFVSSLFVKHSLLPFPITLALWLLYTARGVWVGLAVALGMGSLALCTWIHGIDFIDGVFLSSRQYQLERMVDKLLNYWLYPIFLWIIWGVTFGLRAGEKFYGQLLITYLGVSLVFSAAMLGGHGINYNALFDVLISLALLLGVGVSQVWHSRQKSWGHPLGWMAILALPILLALPSVGLTQEWQALNTTKANTAEIIQALSQADGPVMCEMLSLCYWAGHPLEVDFFNTGQKLKTGAMEASQLITLIERQHFAIIQLDDDNGSSRLPTDINQAIFKYYQVRSPQAAQTTDTPAFLLYPVPLGHLQ